MNTNYKNIVALIFLSLWLPLTYAAPPVLDANASNPGEQVWYHLLKDGSNNEYFAGPWGLYEGGSESNLNKMMQRNLSARAYFGDKQPSGSADRCVHMSLKNQTWAEAGQWDDTGCNNSKYYACFDGYEWAVSAAKGTLGDNNDVTESGVNNGHTECAKIVKNGVTGNFRFAAPASFKQNMELLQIGIKRLGSNTNDTVWINANSKKVERAFVFNKGAQVTAPFWKANEPANTGRCAVQNKDETWASADCNNAKKIACYNPVAAAAEQWKVTDDTYQYTNPVDLSNACETVFGSQYKFYSPVSLSQRKALADKILSGGTVFINGSDLILAGSWVFNTEINSWAANQPSSSEANNQRCVTASALSSDWSSRSCNEQHPVACFSGNLWYFTTGSVSLSDFGNAQQQCNTEFGAGYLFSAPRTLDDAQMLQYSANLHGALDNYWINGNRIEDFGRWDWNKRALKTPVWESGEPNGGSKENCAQISRGGNWADAACNGAERAYLCRSASGWAVSNQTGYLDDFSKGMAACAALGNGYVFASPTTLNENQEVAQLLGASTTVWVNATDALKEGEWLHNAANILNDVNWSTGGATATDQCVYQKDDGTLNRISCSDTQEQPYACTDGKTWRVTRTKGKIAKFAAGHNACFKNFGSEFVFAAPLNKNDAVLLDFARMQTAKEINSSVAKVWLNMSVESANGSVFRRNLPFSNWADTTYIGGLEPSIAGICSYKTAPVSGQDNNPWRVGDCVGKAAHYACTNGNNWQVAVVQSEFANGEVKTEPKVGRDYWSYERGNSLCKEQYGSAYYFSAPISAADDKALDVAIRNLNVDVPDTWINYYYQSALTSNNNRWFANRLKTGIWQKPAFANLNNADCALLHKDGSWTDSSCSTNRAFACLASDGAWTVAGNGAWEAGFDACANSAAMFAVPRTPDEMAALQDAMGADPVWINYTDTGLESQWIANRLQSAWWAAGEPSNQGNRDCARVNKDGEWLAGKCDVEAAPFACRRINTGSNVEWNLTSATGIWSEGFAVCAHEYPGSQFAVPQGYGNISATDDNSALAAIVSDNASFAKLGAWVNFSDAESEGNWRAYQAFSNWGVDSLIDENKDCGFINRTAVGKGSWYVDECAKTTSRQYACTDGYQWQLAAAGTNWSNGFEACQALGSQWRFATPTNAVENSKLKIAMEFAGVADAWINAHDRLVEGEWVINGVKVNFAPIIDTSEVDLVVAENQTYTLKASFTDEEKQPFTSANWTLLSDSLVSDVSQSSISISDVNFTDDQGSGDAVLTAKYTTPHLLKQDQILVFKVTVTDTGDGTAANATAENLVTVRVKAPLIAAWDFNDSSKPYADTTVNGHNATPSDNLPKVSDGSLVLEQGKNMVITGLEIPEDHFSVAFRLSIEKSVEDIKQELINSAGNPSYDPTGDLRLRAIMGKGTALTADPVHLTGQFAFVLEKDSDTLTAITQLDNNANLTASQVIETKQWVNVVYINDGTSVRVLLDGSEVSNQSLAANQAPKDEGGYLYIGDLGLESVVSGLIDDIQIYNRALTDDEAKNHVLPKPPVGLVSFALASDEVDETGDAAHEYVVRLNRTRGSAEALTAYVQFDAARSTASKGADLTALANPADEADFILINEGNKGVAVAWPAGDKTEKSITVKLDSADDGLQEGTENIYLVFNESELEAVNAGLGSPAAMLLRLKDITPNPFGNFSVQFNDGSAEMGVAENAPGPYAICIKRESGKSGAVQVDYLISGNAVKGADFNFVGSNIPTASTGSITFANNGNDQECFSVQVNNDATIGTADKKVTVAITGLTPEADKHPILTAQDSATLTIQDYSAGKFGFEAASYSCKEPNDDNSIPVELRASQAEKTCAITVIRTNIGATAPAAKLNVAAVYRDGSVADFSFPATLEWPAITAKNPASFETEIQTINFTITNDNKQENDKLVDISLTPFGGEKIEAGKGTAELTIIDVTSPALVRVVADTDKNSYQQGELVTFSIKRENNSNTAFSVDYNLSFTDMPSGKTAADFINFSSADTKTTCSSSTQCQGTITFTANGANEVVKKIRIASSIPNPGMTMSFELSNPSVPRVVGIGSLSNVNTDNLQNRMSRAVAVGAVNSKLADIYSINFDGKIFTPEQSVAIPAYTSISTAFEPVRNAVNVNFTLPAGVQSAAENVNYRWEFTNNWDDGMAVPPSLEMTNATGTVAYNNGNNALSVNSSLTIPFVVKETSFVLKLTLVGGGETFSKELTFNVKPLWRQLEHNEGGKCMAPNGRGSCGYDSTTWTWNPTNKMLFNLEAVKNQSDNKCLMWSGSSTDAKLAACNSGVADSQVTFTNGNNFRVDNKRVCRYLNWFTYQYRRNDCNTGDNKWKWRN